MARGHQPQREAAGELTGNRPWLRRATFVVVAGTARPRHTITETDEVTSALKDAARRWPNDRERPAKLLLDLVQEGHRAITAQAESDVAERREAIERTSGALTGTYAAGYLDELRHDWPE